MNKNVCKKEFFETQEKAEYVARIRQLKARRTRSRHGAYYEAYRCKHCGHWHVGRRME